MQPEDLNAPFIYKNWLAIKEGNPALGTAEYPLFSDALVAGDPLIEFGPYQFVNVLMPTNHCGHMQPTLFVRFTYHTIAKGFWSETGKPRYNTFQGGKPFDEISALASLALGIRLRAGDASRKFSEDGDPYGTPVASGSRRDFVLLRGNDGLKLPSVCESYYRRAHIEALKPFELIPKLQPRDIVALLRAARLYQDALWIVESEPSLAWVMLVSAVETAAGHWRGTNDVPPLEIIRNLDPDLYEILRDSGKQDLANKVAGQAAKTLKSTKKFLDFSKTFCPSPPPKRPEREHLRHPWSKGKLRKALNTIYGHRSKMLHEGLPFPVPLCEAPARSGNSYQEVPITTDSSSESNSRGQDDALMLHAFEYIVRESLLKWWKSMPSEV